jgi:hypothetical protein
MTNTDLSTQTPREIDTQLSELYLAEMKAKQARSMTLERIHSAIGERAQYMSRNRKAWPKSDTDAIAEARRIADPNAQANYRPCTPNPRGAFDALAKLDETNTTLAEIRERTAVLDAEYARRPWSRFFIVQNNNGHIHSSMNCKTCYVTTGFGWLPELSGKTEADAVRDHGTVLCSVCFPSAPVGVDRGQGEARRVHWHGGSRHVKASGDADLREVLGVRRKPVHECRRLAPQAQAQESGLSAPQRRNRDPVGMTGSPSLCVP